MQSIEIELGGRTYTIEELPLRKQAAWRKSVQEPFDALVTALVEAPETEMEKLADVGGLVESMSGLLLGSVDQVVELVIGYSPALEADREWLEENAFESEVMAAFVEVLKLAFPFGALVKPARTIARALDEIGSPSVPTSTNSVSRNGDGGRKRSSRRRTKEA